MQVILTEEEYSALLEKSKTATVNKDYTDENYKLNAELTYVRDLYYTLKYEHSELKDKYNKLLVFGVSNSNERLKEKL